MPAGETLHPDFVAALRRLAAREVSYAEAWRLLIPVSTRLGLPRPSYFSVRRVLADERRRTRVVDERREGFLADVLAGRMPRA